ncbi:hypothetical protein C8R44DRAFT_726214 [Mycena epipterygia]|nr:hypothetical protein C8R44DRAFT_726214 [Mycena epipterygia]
MHRRDSNPVPPNIQREGHSAPSATATCNESSPNSQQRAASMGDKRDIEELSCTGGCRTPSLASPHQIFNVDATKKATSATSATDLLSRPMHQRDSNPIQLEGFGDSRECYRCLFPLLCTWICSSVYPMWLRGKRKNENGGAPQKVGDGRCMHLRDSNQDSAYRATGAYFFDCVPASVQPQRCS